LLLFSSLSSIKERQPSAETTRRQFLRGAFFAGVGSALLPVTWKDFNTTINKKVEQIERTRREVEAQGIHPGDPEALRAADQLLDDIAKNPLGERNPDELKRARDARVQQEIFNAARNKILDEIYSKEGSHELRSWADAIGMVAAGGSVVVGVKDIITSAVRAVRTASAENVQNEQM
jgi:hypothetical protein